MDDSLSVYEKELLTHINRYRIKNRLNPLSVDETLQSLAEHHSRYMERKESLNHDHFDERFEKCRYPHCVENVGWNFQTPEAQFTAWKSSRGHNTNLLNRKINYAGIAKVGAYVTFFACAGNEESIRRQR